jgi:hypothetical protein
MNPRLNTRGCTCAHASRPSAGPLSPLSILPAMWRYSPTTLCASNPRLQTITPIAALPMRLSFPLILAPLPPRFFQCSANSAPLYDGTPTRSTLPRLLSNEQRKHTPSTPSRALPRLHRILLLTQDVVGLPAFPRLGNTKFLIQNTLQRASSLPYLTLPYLTLPYLSFPSIHFRLKVTDAAATSKKRPFLTLLSPLRESWCRFSYPILAKGRYRMDNLRLAHPYHSS